MTESTPWLRRCAVLVIQAQERSSYRPEDLIAGRLQAQLDTKWMALAPHRDEAVAVDLDEIAALGRCSSSQWQPATQLPMPQSLLVVQVGVKLLPAAPTQSSWLQLLWMVMVREVAE